MGVVYFIMLHYYRIVSKSVRGLSEESRQLLMNYDWPGNVRELKNALERAMILEEGTLLKSDDLPFSVASGRSGTAVSGMSQMEAGSAHGAANTEGGRKRALPPLSIPEGGTSLEDVEHALVEMALRQSHGNQIRAAKLLDISRDALRYKMKKFGLAHTEEEQPTSSSQS